MGTDKRALTALYADVRLPDGDMHAEIALFILGRRSGKRAVVREGADRQLIAVAARDHPARQILAGAVALKTVHTCQPDDDAIVALKTMRKFRVRRLPVINPDGTLVGMLSWSDAALGGGRAGDRVDPTALVEAYKSFYAHRRARAQV